MSSEAPKMEDMVAQMKAMMERSAPADRAASGWHKAPAPKANDEVLSVSVPISIETDEGKVRVYLHFDGSNAESPEALAGLIESLQEKGLPIDVWHGKGGWGRKKKGWL